MPRTLGCGEAADTIARLRGFGEVYSDFKFGGPYPNPPVTDRRIILEVLAAAGWRYQTDDDMYRFAPQDMRPRPGA